MSASASPGYDSASDHDPTSLGLLPSSSPGLLNRGMKEQDSPMRTPSSPAALLSTFLLGACTTVALQTAAAPDAPASDGAPASSTNGEPLAPTVIPLAEARSATAPHGKATIIHLALGHNAYLGRMRMDPGAAVPVHRDATEEYIHVLEGVGVMTIDGRDYEIGPGTTIFMPANAEVSFQNGETEMQALQVFAGPEPAKKYDAWTANP
jgi:quercetin dioxygenase-like cupin family protein